MLLQEHIARMVNVNPPEGCEVDKMPTDAVDDPQEEAERVVGEGQLEEADDSVEEEGESPLVLRGNGILTFNGLMLQMANM